MSWCFWFPPPGYVKNGIRDEALIESIMIKREEEKKETRPGTVEKPKLRSMVIRNGIKTRGAKMLKKKLSSPPSDSEHNSGSIIRIRLPSQRHKDPEVLRCNEQPCSTSGKIDEAFVQETHEHVPRSGRELEEHPCSTSNIRLPNSAKKNLAPLLVCSPTLALQFKNLVEDWFVPTLQSELTSFGDEDWLFQKKQNLNSEIKSSKDGNVSLCQMNSTSCPHARFLPEADLYALPFTVPF
ncbi:hypothetical protein like AT4G35940 [Hibiscus trionum]|uniref:Uncharacterized protein n=1 Tax=Hibiscus trionum TaxID=183268 RepID=A0A9W7ISM1_HIBTR|nr:hypothetical protein like AT4G35940 [Hibiscus trionum]